MWASCSGDGVQLCGVPEDTLSVTAGLGDRSESVDYSQEWRLLTTSRHERHRCGSTENYSENPCDGLWTLPHG